MGSQPKKYRNFFLDRDGVINTNDFVNTPNDLQFIEKSILGIRILAEQNAQVFVITNQGGIEAGHLTKKDLHDIHVDMTQVIAKRGGRIDKIYYCPHLKAQCECRKPKPGMILEAISKYNLQKKIAVS